MALYPDSPRRPAPRRRARRAHRPRRPRLPALDRRATRRGPRRVARLRVPLGDGRAAARPRHHPRRGASSPGHPPRAVHQRRPAPRRGARRAGRRLPSTTPAATPASAPPRSPCSAACCRSGCPSSRPWRSPPATCPPAPTRAWAATGSTSSRCPAPGSRLVVGDVVGHGIHASATMGRLRTAVRTLADVDLPPDELLTHLDDLVVRLSAEGRRPTGRRLGDDGVGATCLYAVYDPVSRPLHAGPRRPPAARAWSPRTAPATSSTCRPGRRWAWAACRSSPPSSSCPRAACSPSTPTA